MAERVAKRWLGDAGITGVEVTSAATSREELGAPIDDRARRTLEEAGYDAAGHSAHQITADEIDAADLVVAMEDIHVSRMRSLTGRDNERVVLLTSFDPSAEPGAGVPDPWYGGQEGFTDTLASIEQAMPGLLDWVTNARSRPDSPQE